MEYAETVLTVVIDLDLTLDEQMDLSSEIGEALGRFANTHQEREEVRHAVVYNQNGTKI